MLASPAPDVAAAMEKLSPAGVEWKLDGIRAQVHRDGSDVAVFSRSLDDITARVPAIVEAALALPVRSVVLDGEAIALREDGRPHAFQDTAGRDLHCRRSTSTSSTSTARTSSTSPAPPAPNGSPPSSPRRSASRAAPPRTPRARKPCSTRRSPWATRA